MKKLVLGILCGVFALNACFALTVCARNNTYVAVFHKDINGTVTRTNADNKEWEINFGYKTISGNAACNEISGTYGQPTTNLVTTNQDEGQYCWCQMFPVLNFGYESGQSSYWVFLNDYGDVAGCAGGCTANCASKIATDQTFRSYVFEAIW